MIDLRPDDSYRRVWVVEQDATPAAEPAIEAAYLPSATAWRLVSEHGAAVSIDVQLGTVRPWLPGGAAEIADQGAPRAFDSQASRERLQGRDATHVHVLPLRVPGGAVGGMVSFEARCPSAFAEALFPACHARLRSSPISPRPYLVDLPCRPAAAPRVDELPPRGGPRDRGALRAAPHLRPAGRDHPHQPGRPGVGKSRLARWCHEQSRRRGRPFETLDLLERPGGPPDGGALRLAAGRLHRRRQGHAGRPRPRGGGTLFVDEIDKLSHKAQAGLLRVLEERGYRPLGEGAGDRRADVRFIVGTNQNLLDAVRTGRFREDLYYRINVLPVRLPALAERRDEIPGWAEYMLARRHREGGRAGRGAPGRGRRGSAGGGGLAGEPPPARQHRAARLRHGPRRARPEERRARDRAPARGARARVRGRRGRAARCSSTCGARRAPSSSRPSAAGPPVRRCPSTSQRRSAASSSTPRWKSSGPPRRRSGSSATRRW